MPADPRPRLPHSILWAALLVVLAWAPLPLASNRPWSWALLALLVGLLVLAWAALALAVPEPLDVPPAVVLAALACGLVLLWIWAQVRPDVPGLHPLLTAHPVWEVARAAGAQVEPTLSIDPWNTRDAAMRLLAYLGAFWLAFALCRHPRRARGTLLAIVVIGTAYASYGLVLHFAGIEWVLGTEKTWYRGDVTATFVNRNHFAAYANLALLAALGLLVESFLAARGIADLRRRAAELLARLLGRKSALLVAVLVLATAMLLTHSRGGLSSGLAGIATLLLLVSIAVRPGWRTLVTTVSLAGGLLGALVAFSGADTLARFEQIAGDANLEAGTRLAAYELALRALADRPWTGHGYGGWEQVFHLYRDARFATVFDRLHNTPLEHAVELGLPATALLYLAPLAIFALCVRGVLVRRRHQVYPLVAAAATVTMGLHALVDFALQIPAVAVTFAVILGVGAAQATPSAARSPAGSPAVGAGPVPAHA